MSWSWSLGTYSSWASWTMPRYDTMTRSTSAAAAAAVAAAVVVVLSLLHPFWNLEADINKKRKKEKMKNGASQVAVSRHCNQGSAEEHPAMPASRFQEGTEPLCHLLRQGPEIN